jgi:hypothetical protein
MGLTDDDVSLLQVRLQLDRPRRDRHDVVQHAFRQVHEGEVRIGGGMPRIDFQNPLGCDDRLIDPVLTPNDYEAYFAISKAREGDEEYLLKAIAINRDYLLAYTWLSTAIYLPGRRWRSTRR